MFKDSGTTHRSPAVLVSEAAAARSAPPPRREARERCPDARAAVAHYRSRASTHRAVRGLDTRYPAGRKPRSCPDARHLAAVWTKRAAAEREATTRWRTMDEHRSWQRAIREVQVVYPGTAWWLDSCSRSEGAGRSGEAPWVPNRQGSGAGGWLQFMHSTFWRMFTAARADAQARGFHIPNHLASWYSRTGQALAGAWGLTNGRRHEWSGAGC